MKKKSITLLILFCLLIITGTTFILTIRDKGALKKYYAYCTCGHPGRGWKGPARANPVKAEKDVAQHNRQPHHCATIQEILK